MDIRNLFTSSFLCFVFGSLEKDFFLIDNWPVLFNEDFPFLVLVALLDLSLSPSPFLAPFTLVRSEKVPRCPYSTLYRRNHNIVFHHRRISLSGDKLTFRDVARMKFHRDAMYGVYPIHLVCWFALWQISLLFSTSLILISPVRTGSFHVFCSTLARKKFLAAKAALWSLFITYGPTNGIRRGLLAACQSIRLVGSALIAVLVWVWEASTHWPMLSLMNPYWSWW